jgi:hypothetical protein
MMYLGFHPRHLLGAVPALLGVAVFSLAVMGVVSMAQGAVPSEPLTPADGAFLVGWLAVTGLLLMLVAVLVLLVQRAQDRFRYLLDDLAAAGMAVALDPDGGVLIAVPEQEAWET